MLVDHGGDGGPILLLHGLMGRGRTWLPCLPWLRRHGRVHTYDAPHHRGTSSGRIVAEGGAITTEAFVNDIATILAEWQEPAILIGHSMGGLHAWCTAAEHPDAVRAIVVEDMCPDYRGRTTQPWDAWFASWPTEFTDENEVLDMFGPVAGRYFLDSFDRTATGWRLHGHIATWRAIANHWGTRDYWRQWEDVRCPALLVEGEHTLTIPGQMSDMASVQRASWTDYLKVPGAGHLIHDEAPDEYRGAVEAFLSALPARGRGVSGPGWR
ncbi:alpha/beta hydrolase [Hoyosella sp. G463]|uniref:Alpha/beta hydrolase n=1 Tax=Lolliginicoccus lacisalsi TaxID=2742202 RepID=A0A927PMU4_9ACTN|nr:alpha/beta hydrolase [Lolliginicoccus lacisalsi]